MNLLTVPCKMKCLTDKKKLRLITPKASHVNFPIAGFTGKVQEKYIYATRSCKFFAKQSWENSTCIAMELVLLEFGYHNRVLLFMPTILFLGEFLASVVKIPQKKNS